MYFKGKEKNGAVHGDGSRVKGLLVLKTGEEHVYMLKNRILKREKWIKKGVLGPRSGTLHT